MTEVNSYLCNLTDSQVHALCQHLKQPDPSQCDINFPKSHCTLRMEGHLGLILWTFQKNTIRVEGCQMISIKKKWLKRYPSHLEHLCIGGKNKCLVLKIETPKRRVVTQENKKRTLAWLMRFLPSTPPRDSQFILYLKRTNPWDKPLYSISCFFEFKFENVKPEKSKNLVF